MRCRASRPRWKYRMRGMGLSQTPEGRIKTAIRQYLDGAGIYYDSVRGGTYSRPGSPDLVMCLGGHYIGLEVKAADGRLSHIQSMRARAIERSGGVYLVIHTLGEVMDVVSAYQTNGTIPGSNYLKNEK